MAAIDLLRPTASDTENILLAKLLRFYIGVSAGDISWPTSGGGSGDVTASGTLTSGAVVVGLGSKTIKVITALTIDGSGNLSTSGTISTGVGGSTAGAVILGQGTTQSPGVNNVTLQAPASVATSYVVTLESAPGSSGFLYGTVAGTTVTLSKVAANGTGNVLLSAGTAAIASGKTLTVSNTLTFTGTDASSVAFGGGGTVAFTANKLSAFAATTSSELAGVISDETGSGSLMFGTNPTRTFAATSLADDTYTGDVITGYNAGEALTQWDVVYLSSSSTWLKGDSDAAGKAPVQGVVVATTSNGNPATVLVRGVFRDDGGTAWTPGGTVFLSTTAGALTQTAPTAASSVVQSLGVALSAHVVQVNVSSVWFTN